MAMMRSFRPRKYDDASGHYDRKSMAPPLLAKPAVDVPNQAIDAYSPPTIQPSTMPPEVQRMIQGPMNSVKPQMGGAADLAPPSGTTSRPMLKPYQPPKVPGGPRWPGMR